MRRDKFDEAIAMFEMSVTFALQRFGRRAWLTMNVPPTSRKRREIWATLYFVPLLVSAFVSTFQVVRRSFEMGFRLDTSRVFSASFAPVQATCIPAGDGV
jgi:hypothetical protein